MSKKEKYIPLRRCMGCNMQKEKKDLIRIVKLENNSIEIDLLGNKPGRGAYICKKEECLDKVIKSGRLSKVLNTNIEKEFLESIRGIL